MALTDSYLDRTELKSKSIAPASMIDGSHIDPSGDWTDPAKLQRRVEWFAFIDETLKDESDEMNARLRKRYIAPFASPYPRVVTKWLGRIVTPLLYLKRGVDASDEQYVEAVRLATKADEEIQQAADAVEGLFELPLRQDQQTAGVTRGTPLGYSEATPYDWTDRQAEERGYLR